MTQTPRAPRTVASTGPRVAYLVSQYPALSHAFIEREVLALRARGVDVHTFTVRRAPDGAPFSETTRAELRTTSVLLGRPVREYLAAQADLLRSSPAAWLSGLRTALGAGPRRLRPRVWQLFYLAEAAVLVRDLRARGIRHVHVHFANNGADVARLAVAIGRALDGPDAGWRWTFSMHGPTEFEDVVGHDLAAKTRSADAVACISDWCRAELARLVPDDHRRKMGIVRMSVSGEAYPPMSADREGRGGRLRVLFVGRLVREKGPDVLLEAVDRLRTDGVDVDVAVVGQGPLADALREQVERLDLGDRVRLLGPIGQTELPQWYGWADVFCLPSYAEGVPVVLMEAMATELPVVTTRINGIPELVEHGVTGHLVEPGHPEQVAAALAQVARDAAGREAMGRRGRLRVTAEFDPESNAARLVEVVGISAPRSERASPGTGPGAGG